MNSHALKALQSRHRAACAAADEARRVFKSASETLARAEKEARDATALIADAEETFTVSEHALLRYFQRVHDADLNAAVDAITAEIAPLVEQLGDGTYPLNVIAPGFVAVVKQKTVVTIEKKD